MPRIRPEDRTYTQDFRALKAEGRQIGEHNDCTVIAIAAACGVPYEQAHAALAAAGRKPGKGASYFVMRTALAKLGKDVAARTAREFIATRYPKAHRVLKSVTTHHPARFNKVWRDGRSYILCLKTNHVAAVVDGELHDWSRGRALQCDLIWEICDA